MLIVVTDTRAAVVDALMKTLDHLQIPPGQHVEITIHRGPVDAWDGPGTCYIHGGNAVGSMDGKLDTCLQRLVPGCQEDVRNVINKWGHTARDGTRHLPLFSSLLSSGNGRYLITSPCMYLPGPGNQRGTRNAFHATHTALSMVRVAMRAGIPIKTVVITGMCSGRGRMNRDEVASQMTDAFRAVFIDDNLVVDPNQASHKRLMMNPLYTVQPVCPEVEPFQPLEAHITASGTRVLRQPPANPPKKIRSGGSENKTEFKHMG